MVLVAGAIIKDWDSVPHAGVCQDHQDTCLRQQSGIQLGSGDLCGIRPQGKEAVPLAEQVGHSQRGHHAHAVVS
jgi:hypothetical protein